MAKSMIHFNHTTAEDFRQVVDLAGRFYAARITTMPTTKYQDPEVSTHLQWKCLNDAHSMLNMYKRACEAAMRDSQQKEDVENENKA